MQTTRRFAAADCDKSKAQESKKLAVCVALQCLVRSDCHPQVSLHRFTQLHRNTPLFQSAVLCVLLRQLRPNTAGENAQLASEIIVNKM